MLPFVIENEAKKFRLEVNTPDELAADIRYFRAKIRREQESIARFQRSMEWHEDVLRQLEAAEKSAET